jgi:hypothetical protein
MEARAMAAFSATLSPPIVAAYDFSRFRCLADVGGGTGRQLADILKAHPALTGILFDLATCDRGGAPVAGKQWGERPLPP